jgi:hypothetical protein
MATRRYNQQQHTAPTTHAHTNTAVLTADSGRIGQLLGSGRPYGGYRHASCLRPVPALLGLRAICCEALVTTQGRVSCGCIRAE